MQIFADLRPKRKFLRY